MERSDNRADNTDEILKDIFMAGVKSVDPYEAVKRNLLLSGDNLEIGGHGHNLDNYEKIFVIGAGKAASSMAKAAEEILGNRLTEGIIVVKYGHALPLKRITQVEASHPLPDEAGEKGTLRITATLKRAAEKTLVICLLSGGASALLVSPREGVSLEDKKITSGLLMSAGADISELNAVRKHLSLVKGGGLAKLAHPARLASLILSDVIGDKLNVIASGPTVPDPTTFEDALRVVKKYGLYDRVPEGVRKVLQDGASGRTWETPKKDAPFFKNTLNIVIGSVKKAISAAREKAATMGFETTVVTEELSGEAREGAKWLAAKAVKAKRPGKKLCLISGGETTVTVKGDGLGGRNQELALTFAVEIKGIGGITLLSAGTDGTDGPTDAAGAIVDGGTAPKAGNLGIVPEKYLERNDSYGFFAELDAAAKTKRHLKTGPTGTNVMDLQIIIAR